MSPPDEAADTDAPVPLMEGSTVPVNLAASLLRQLSMEVFTMLDWMQPVSSILSKFLNSSATAFVFPGLLLPPPGVGDVPEQPLLLC